MIKEEIATTAGDIAGADAKVGGKPERRRLRKVRDPEDCPNKKVIEESDGYSFYQAHDMNVFEISDDNAKQTYLMGLKQNKPQVWGSNEITSTMMRHMNSEQGRNFTVKVNGTHSFPLKNKQ